MERLDGRTALVTGATDGVGRLVATRLGEAGAHVLVHGRNRKRGAEVVEAIEAAGGKAEFLAANLASLAEVRALADAVRRRTDRIDILVNNAGIGFGTKQVGRETSVDGYELRFAVNYLACLLLTELLLPVVVASAPARIVNVASLGQFPIDFDDLMLTRDYEGVRAYRQSKLAQVMYTLDLAERLKGSGVTATCLHPATYMDTTMVRQAGVTPTSTVEEGVDAVLNLAVSPELEGVTGRFYNGLNDVRANDQAYDTGVRDRLRQVSLELVGLDALTPMG